MKKLLLAGVAALLMVTSAHADATLSPTDPLIGGWCDIKGTTLLKRGTCDFTIAQDGYSYIESSCTFLEIKRIRNGIEAFSECSSDNWQYEYEKAVFQILGERLKMQTTKPHTFKVKKFDVCVLVQATPNGYLNLRQGPGMQSKPIVKLNIGQTIKADVQTDEWTHITDYETTNGKVSGWVYSRYLDKDGGYSCRSPHGYVEPKCDIPGCDQISPTPRGFETTTS